MKGASFDHDTLSWLDGTHNRESHPLPSTTYWLTTLYHHPLPSSLSLSLSPPPTVICLLSGLDTEVEHTVGGLRKAYMQDPRQSGLRIGLVWCPRSNSLLLNSTPGFLQFYDPFTDTVTKEVQCTCIISRYYIF